MTRTPSAVARVVPLAAVNFVALGTLAVPSVAAIPVSVDQFTAGADRADALAHVLAWGAAVAIVSNPVFGYLSDRTRTRWGSRRPWMAFGALLSVAAAVLVATAPTLVTLTVGWALMQAGVNAVLAAVAALLSDTVPDERRAAASGLFSAAAFLGTVPGLVLASLFPAHLGVVVTAMAVVALAVVIVCCTLVPERPQEGPGGAAPPEHPEDGDRTPHPDGARSPSADDRHPEASVLTLVPFAAVWGQRLLQGLAFSLVTSLTLYLVADRMTQPGSATSAATSVTSVSTVIGGAAIVAGALLVARFGRTWGLPTFLLLGGAGLSVAAVIRAFATDPAALWASSAIGGLAFGWFVAANFAVALRFTPTGLGGRYLGALNVAETIPQLVAPFAAAALLSWGNDVVSWGNDVVSWRDDAVSRGNGIPGLSALPDGYAVIYLAAAALSLCALTLLRVVARHIRDADREAPRRQSA
jgi:MFS family permease